MYHKHYLFKIVQLHVQLIKIWCFFLDAQAFGTIKISTIKQFTLGILITLKYALNIFHEIKYHRGVGIIL